MMNNPMMQILNIARGGGNPIPIMQQMAGGNSQIAQAMQIINGKNPQQLQQTAMNMARERGIDIAEMISAIGLK